MNRVLFIATHPDDETLGCGGTILRHQHLGDEIFWLIVTNIDSTNIDWPVDMVKNRQKEIDAVAAKYKFKKIFKLDFPAAKLESIPIAKIIKAISAVINEVKPQWIYIPNKSDIHTDHQVTFKASMSSTKNFRAPYIRKIMMYETLSETEFAAPSEGTIFCPNVFVDITPYIDAKLDIIKTYKSEIMPAPFPRSFETIKALARFRGSRAGVKFAEAFALLEEII